VPSGIRAPKVHFGAIAAGEIVQNSRISHEAKWIREHYNDALAIEMEAAGVAQAGHLNGSPVAIVRGISDRADGTKVTSEDGTWQPLVAANAAAFAIRLAEELIKEREHTVMGESNSMKNGGVVTNFSSGQVGIQAAHVTGSTVWMGAAPQASTRADFVAELALFREHLLRECSIGNLDEVTYDAAQAELNIVGEALQADTPEDKSKLFLALKRLRGLIVDVADLATKIALLIAAAKGLS
jgi:adenosylhomocysteine nucleosidase